VKNRKKTLFRFYLLFSLYFFSSVLDLDFWPAPPRLLGKFLFVHLSQQKTRGFGDCSHTAAFETGFATEPSPLLSLPIEVDTYTVSGVAEPYEKVGTTFFF
jgi:hypothetical protein